MDDELFPQIIKSSCKLSTWTNWVSNHCLILFGTKHLWSFSTVTAVGHDEPQRLKHGDKFLLMLRFNSQEKLTLHSLVPRAVSMILNKIKQGKMWEDFDVYRQSRLDHSDVGQDNSDVAFSFTHFLDHFNVEKQFVPTQTRHKLKCVDTDGASTSGLHPVWLQQNYRFRIIMDSKRVATRVRRDKHVSFREASIFMD